MEKKQGSVGSWISGMAVGALIALVGVGVGHKYWPSEPVSLSDHVGSATSTGKEIQNGSAAKSLLLAENTIADIAKEAADSVVNINITSSITITDSPFDYYGLPFRSPFDLFFGQGGGGGEPHQRKFEKEGIGSGLILRPDGYILTNNHVVGNADTITVTLNDKRKFKGTVVGRDKVTDLALVKIDVKGLRAARLGTSKNLEPGDFVIAIGSPLGYDHSVTLGIISALGRSLDIQNTGYERNIQLIQTDAAINPGNSGGPLLNIHGEVIGINQAIRGDAQNIGFAIPIDMAKEISDQLMTKGTIERPYLGIYMKELDEKLAKSIGLPATTKGVVIAGLAQDGPAVQAGLLQADVIQKVDGKAVENGKQIQDIVRSHKPGETLSLLIVRNGQIKPLSVKIGTYPDK
jgi:S1-C subfamily serine protease